MPFQPKVSIVINTDARAKALAVCLESLRYLRYPDFEVIVVAGPTRDGTHELCESWAGTIKYGRCPVRNLSQSRNIGIAMAAGEIVAYIDDDAVPEPEWLDAVVAAFEDPQVGVAGGFLHDHTGKAYQWRYGTANRFASPNTKWERPAPEFNFPRSFNTPQVIGANSVFRREALLHIGGFDEEYEYFLDETDVTTRIVDAGWTVAQLDRAFVHHKFAPSDIRNHAKAVTSWYSIIKNKTYFAVVYGSDYAPFDAILWEVQQTIGAFRGALARDIHDGLLPLTFMDRFEDETSRALRDGLAHAARGQRRLPDAQFLHGGRDPFVRFPPIVGADQQRCYVLLTRNYPPEPVGGVARYIHQLARTLARRGHQVHVLAGGSGHDRVDFEEGVWVHRIVAKEHAAPRDERLRGIPPNIWNHSRTMLDEAREIASRRPVDAVYGPIWDTEGIAFAGEPDFPLVTSLQTTLRFYLDSNPHLQRDARFMRDFAEPMLRAEKLLLERSDGIHAISHAITEKIESAYGIEFGPDRLWTVPLGLEDWTTQAAAAPPADGDVTRIVFVGRLESRKGVDIVMQVAPTLLADDPSLRLEFVGNDRIPEDGGRTWRERFEAQPGFAGIADRVIFHGELDDAGLRAAYRSADIVLAPSRFESFGLVHLEAAMYGKPVVGCRIGGMVEVVDDGVTGLLAEPGDAASLLHAVTQLVRDPALRARLGAAARRRYLEGFTPERMAEGVLDIFRTLAQRRPARAPMQVAVAPGAVAPPEEQARAAGPLRIALVGSVLAPHDAISNDLVRQARFLRAAGWSVSVFAGHNARKDIEARAVGSVAELLLARDFQAADLIVWHFGIYYPHFDALCVGNGHARQVVVFHNITPPEFVSERARPVIEQSFAQLTNLRAADAIWADSRENAQALIERGFEPGKITIQPLAVDRPARQGIRAKARTDKLQIVFIGRIVRAKGLLDLVEAVALLGDARARVRVKVVGDLEGAEVAFRDELLARVRTLGLADTIEFTGGLPDAGRDRVLAESHILAVPSYHEGFCVPVIEALRAGLVPVVYAAHNLRYIADGLCISCAPGDVAGFAAALSRALEDVGAVLADPAAAHLRLDRGAMTAAEFERSVAAHVDQFEPEVVAQRLRGLVTAVVGADARAAALAA